MKFQLLSASLALLGASTVSGKHLRSNYPSSVLLEVEDYGPSTSNSGSGSLDYDSLEPYPGDLEGSTFSAVAEPVKAAVAAAAIQAGVPVVERLVGSLGDKDTYRRKNDQYIFFEGNFCSENIAGSFWARGNRGIQDYVNAKQVSFFENDEARSVLIQGPIRKGEVLFLWDSPDGHSGRDDHTRIEVTRNMKLGEGYCVNTFERSYADSYVRVKYNRKNGLDGKVSLVANTPRRVTASSFMDG